MRPGRESRVIEAILFVSLLLGAAYFPPRWANWNQNSHLDLVLALVDQQTFCIDDYADNTGDYAQVGDHRYSDKAPGLSFLAVPVYAAARPVLNFEAVRQRLERTAGAAAFAQTLQPDGSGLRSDKVRQAAILTIVALLVVGVPSAILGVLMFRFLGDLGASRGWNATIVLVYGFATCAFPFAGSFFSHQLTASLLFGGFYLGHRIRRGSIARVWGVVAGFLLGYAVITEYPAAIAVAALAIYLLKHERSTGRVAIIAAMGLPLVLLAAHNAIVFGSPFELGYRYSALYRDLHGRGFISLTYPKLSALWGLTFAPDRGLFYISPVLILAPVGLYLWWASGRLRAECGLCIYVACAFLVFNASSAMWRGGFSVGPRYLVPMIPFLVLGLGPFAAALGSLRIVRAVFGVLALWSLCIVWALSIAGQAFPDMTANPLLNYALPRLLSGDVARNLGMALGLSGWASVLPLIAVLGAAAVALGFLVRHPSPEGLEVS